MLIGVSCATATSIRPNSARPLNDSAAISWRLLAVRSHRMKNLLGGGTSKSRTDASKPDGWRKRQSDVKARRQNGFGERRPCGLRPNKHAVVPSKTGVNKKPDEIKRRPASDKIKPYAAPKKSLANRHKKMGFLTVHASVPWSDNRLTGRLHRQRPRPTVRTCQPSACPQQGGEE